MPQEGKDATVILLWSGAQELLRELLAICTGGALGTLPSRKPGKPVVSGTRWEPNPADQRPRRVQRVARGVLC